MNTMIKVMAAVVVCMCLVASLAPAQVTIHNWNFNVNVPVGTNAQWPSPIPATTGTGVLTHNFTDVQAFTGSTINEEPGDGAGFAFCPRGAANGQTFTLAVPTTGYVNPYLSYATRGTSTGFTSQVIEYSLDGTTFLADTTNFVITTSYALIVVDFSNVLGSYNNPNFKVRFTLNGSSSTSGNNRFDNVKITAYTPLADGDGIASLQDSTAGALQGSNIFPRSTSGLKVSVSVTGTPTGPLDAVKLIIPAGWTGFSSGNVSLGGAFAGKTMASDANSITVQSAALGTTAGTITITSLTSPSHDGPLQNGNDAWVVQTAKSGGTLASIARPPVSYTIIPIRNLRTGGFDGYGNINASGDTSAMNGQTVALAGVATVRNGIINSILTQMTFFIQQGGYGMEVFGISPPVTTWAKGDSIVVKGSIATSGGSTNLVPASTVSPDFYNMGPGVLPSPQLLASAAAIKESTEARLVQLSSVNWNSAGATFDTMSLGRNNFTTGPDTGTTYLNPANNIFHTTIPASSPLTGIVFHQTNLWTGVARPYKLAPRDLSDLGYDPASGSGTASITPVLRFSSLTAVAETLTVVGDGVNTIAGVSVTIPSTWTWTNTLTHFLSGAGFASATVTVTGDGSSLNPYVITIDGAAVTNTNTGIIAIGSLNTPSGVGLTPFVTKTRGAAGGMINILSSPAVNIITSFSAIQSGNWSNPATWFSGAVPGPADDVAITSLNVTVTIDIANAECNSLTMVGSGSDTTGGGTGPILRFQSTGTPQLTVNTNLSISGGSGSGNRGGRPTLTSNGNATAVLIVKGNISSSSSNSTSNGSAGLNMNEGTVKVTGSSPTTVTIGAGLRLGDLEIGDGTLAKTMTLSPTTSATMTVRRIAVKQNSTFLIGATNANATTIGSTSTGIPKLNGGITIDPGASLSVQSFVTGYTSAINLDSVGITNNGSLSLRNGLSSYTLNVGFSGGSPTSNMTIGGSNVGQYGNVAIASGHTLTLQRGMVVPSDTQAVVVNGTLAETAGNTIVGIVRTTRTVAATSLETFGGIGLELNTGATAPGSTAVTRVTGVASVGGSSSSILRYFDITPTTNTGLGLTMRYFYDNSELAGQNAATLQLWRSPDQGTTWTAAGGTVNTTLRRIELAAVDSFSRWTASDAAHPLSGGGTVSLNVAIASGWNLISNPVTNPVPGDSVKQLYPTSINAYAFEFLAGYVQRFRLVNGKGYWEKFPGAISQSITGTPRTRDSISVVAGWNIVGTISNTVDTNTIVSVPPGLRASQWFGYAAGYTPVTQLVPGKGYWLKSSAAGKFVLANPLVSGPAKVQASGESALDALNRLTITDSRGGSQTLYFGADAKNEIQLPMFVMPPAPPAGALDARFETAEGGSMVQTHAAKVSEPVEFSVAVQSDAYPLTVSWKVNGVASYELTDGRSGQIFRTKEMAGEGSIKITNSELGRFSVKLVGDGQLPADFALSQNYPNPFNPTTSIKYALPVDSRVTMDLYNVLGQRVRTLTSDNLAAGYHVAEWDGTGNAGQQLASGVYFLQMSAKGVNGKSFNEIRKLIMLK